MGERSIHQTNRKRIDISGESKGDFFIDKEGNISPTAERIERITSELRPFKEAKEDGKEEPYTIPTEVRIDDDKS